MKSYPHMCRMDHIEIGHADSENELCPLCAVINQRDALAAELAMLSGKACAAVVAYRAALGKLTDGFKYPAEVCQIARTALAHSTEFTSAQRAGDTNG